MPTDDMTNFKFLNEDEILKGSHPVRRGTLSGSPKTWISKQMPNSELTQRELLAQEFFRLIIPHQPETRMMRDHRKASSNYEYDVYHILSEEVEGYHDLPVNEQNSFNDGTIKGLGQPLVTALYLQEVDLKNGNIGLDNQNRVIKIDGDYCFAQFDAHPDFKKPGLFKLSPEAINALPYPVNFVGFAWLDYVEKEIHYGYSNILNDDVMKTPQFRSEVNEGLLKICIMSDQCIDAFTNFYVLPPENKQYSDLLKARRDELKQSALQNESFRSYLQTSQANLDGIDLLNQVVSMQSGGIPVIDPALHDEITTEIGQLQSELRSKAVQLELHLQDLRTEGSQLLQSLTNLSNPQDSVLNQFISDNSAIFKKNQNDPVELQNMISNLKKASLAMDSDEFKSVTSTVTSFRAENGYGMEEKANNIELALFKTPVYDRGTVISNSNTNDVQIALATHRHPFRDSPVKGNQIDYENAATNFKILKDKFKQVKEPDEPDRDENLTLK